MQSRSRDLSRSFQSRTESFGAVGEEEDWFEFFIRGGGQDGVVAGRVEAKDDLGTLVTFESDAVLADGNASVGACFEV